MNSRQNPYILKFVLYFLMVHIVGLYGLVYAWKHASATIIWSAVVYYFVCHFSITLAAHRYYTHGSFKMHRVLEYLWAILFCGVGQNSFFWWVGKHLEHHQYEDTANDPHSPQHGFFHAHMGWVMKQKGAGPPSKRYLAKFAKGAQTEYRVLMWQHKYYVALFPLMTFGVPIVIGYLEGDVLGGLIVIGFTRLLFQYHGTWAVNSFGHTVGEHLDGLATNFGILALCGVKIFKFVSAVTIMPLLAILTVGEVWHANHHISSAHWRLGRKWWQIDPGAYLISTLSVLGVVWDLKEPADRLRVPVMKE
jgi:stearoyl-CoA desaturase (delta-9 desaturase)